VSPAQQISAVAFVSGVVSGLIMWARGRSATAIFVTVLGVAVVAAVVGTLLLSEASR
jgi:hypothetical protein